MSGLISRAVYRAFRAVAAKVTPLVSAKLGSEKKMSLIGDVRESRFDTTRNVSFYPTNKQSLVEQIHHDSGVAIRL